MAEARAIRVVGRSKGTRAEVRSVFDVYLLYRKMFNEYSRYHMTQERQMLADMTLKLSWAPHPVRPA